MDGVSETAWKPPRPCEDYLSEFRHCVSFSNRFHHYYVYGSSTSCQQWKEDYNNCSKWEKRKHAEAKEALQKSERNRVTEQRNFTPVWELRQKPPIDWYLPLNYKSP